MQIAMVNQSKINDPRFWGMWRDSGAVSSIDGVLADYRVGDIRLKKTSTPGMYEVFGFSEFPILAGVHSCPILPIDMYFKTSSMKEMQNSPEVQNEVIEGQYALIIDLNGNFLLYTADKIEKTRKNGRKDIGFKPAPLTIKYPDGIHEFEIVYESDSRLKCRAYNLVIEKVCREKKLGPFYQIGSNEETGYKAWEMLGRDTSGQELKALIPEIHKRAKEEYFKLKEWGF